MTSRLNDLMIQFQATLKQYQLEPTKHAILISFGEKKLYLLINGELHFTFIASGSKNPMSCVVNSEGTPWGLHKITEKYGDNEPAGTVFVARQSTHERYTERADFGPDQKALVTTRILRLTGLEPNINTGDGIDSYSRYIYIHGVNHPEIFPEHQSAGCINLLDDDLIHLYNAVPVGSFIYIAKDL